MRTYSVKQDDEPFNPQDLRPLVERRETNDGTTKDTDVAEEEQMVGAAPRAVACTGIASNHNAQAYRTPYHLLNVEHN